MYSFLFHSITFWGRIVDRFIHVVVYSCILFLLLCRMNVFCVNIAQHISMCVVVKYSYWCIVLKVRIYHSFYVMHRKFLGSFQLVKIWISATVGILVYVF